MVTENKVPELCEACRETQRYQIALRNGVRCFFARQTEYMGYFGDGPPYGPYDGCSLERMAQCGHRTNIPQRNGMCIGANDCPDYWSGPTKSTKLKPWWKFW